MMKRNFFAAGACLAALGGLTDAERTHGRFLRDGSGHNPGDGRRELSPEEAAREVKALFETKTNEVKAIAEKALAEAERGVPMSETAKQLADQAISGMNEAKARLDDLEQKMARRGSDDDEASMTAGERFVNADEFKAFAGQTRPRGRLIVEVKDISSLTTDAAGSVGALVTQATRVSAPPLPQRRMTIRALLAPGNTNSNLIEYDREKGFTNNAAPVAEGDPKPQSEIQYEDASAPVRTIAHWMRASVQILADAPGLRSIIDQRLRYGLAYKEEVQLLTGSGSGQNLSGLITNATTYSASFAVAGETQIDKLRLAMLQVALAEYAANGHVLNPIDWAVIETLKDGEGRYLIGNPQGGVQAQLWGLPVVATQAQTVDKFLTGAFDLAAQIFDRQDATVEVSTEDGDNFTKNKVTIRAEERLALAIYRPESLIYGDFGRV
jgi:HK97 family phage major capsid protein